MRKKDGMDKWIENFGKQISETYFSPKRWNATWVPSRDRRKKPDAKRARA